MELDPADLGLDTDPGCDWHPRSDKPQARDVDGNLRDLSAEEISEHAAKPEALDQLDAGVEPMSAEDSALSPEGEV